MVPDKQSQRKMLLHNRRSLTDEERKSFSAGIIAKIISLPEYRRADTCLLFASMRDEVQTKELILDALKAGKRVCLPYITSVKDSLMQAAQIRSLDDLEEGAYGILAVKADRLHFIAPEELDFILVPAVGMDRQGWRMGMGGGYYDRYLPRAAGAVRACAIYGCQLAECIARDEHDARADFILTETDLIRITR